MYLPSKKELAKFRDLVVGMFNSMPAQYRARGCAESLEGADRVTMANLLAAVQLLNSMGALRPEWLEKQTKLVAKEEKP